MKTISKLLPLAGVLLLAAAPLLAQTVPLDLEFGYRFVQVSGNDDEYRSQINDGQGLILRNINFATADLGAQSNLMDHFRLDGSDLGAGPAGSLRLEAGRTGLYDLHFSYRRSELFSALPDFANPLFPVVIPGQQTYDRTRNLFDVDLELLPGHIITPIIGYTRNTYSGPDQTTYFVGQDEFRLASNLDDVDQEVRVGAAFADGPVSGRVIEGWRQFRETQGSTLAPGEKNGNNAGLVLGVPVDLNSLTRGTSTDTNTPSTSAMVTGQVGPRLRLIGSYQRASAEADTSEAEDLSGNLVSFQISRFFAGLTETASTRSRATMWNGGGRAELSIVDDLDLTVGWTRRHRYMDGYALVSTLYLQTVTFAGLDPKDLLALLQANDAMDRTDDVYEARLSARGLGPFGLNVGWSQDKEDVSVTPDASQIIVPGGQEGDFERRVNTWTAGGSYTRSGFTLGTDYQRDRANDPIVRTDFLDRDRYRVRLSWSDPADHLQFSGNFGQTNASNDQPGFGYDARIREYGGDLEVLPVKVLRMRFSANRYESDSTLLYRVPQNFSTANSIQRESGLGLEGSVILTPFSGFSLEGSCGHFQNEGSYAFTIDRARLSGEVPVTRVFGLVAEWTRDKYNDAAQGLGSLGHFAANRYGLYVHWHP